jgi:hypothetical protein
MDISHDHNDFLPQIPFLGCDGLYSLTLYTIFFSVPYNITRPIMVLELKFRFSALKDYFPKSIYHLYKISDTKSLNGSFDLYNSRASQCPAKLGRFQTFFGLKTLRTQQIENYSAFLGF